MLTYTHNWPMVHTYAGVKTGVMETGKGNPKTATELIKRNLLGKGEKVSSLL